MEKMLLLLLGLAINGEKKEMFIEQIQQKLDTQTQIQLIPYIKLVNDDINFSITKNVQVEFDHHQTHQTDHDYDQQSQTKSMTSTSTSTTTTNSTNNLNLIHSSVNSRATSSSSDEYSDPTFVSSYSSSGDEQSSLSNQQNITVIETNNRTSSSFSFNSIQRDAASGTQKLTRLKYANLGELNYFLNTKLIPNLQRVVDERDAYLEQITELEQDKEYLSTNGSNHHQQQHQQQQSPAPPSIELQIPMPVNGGSSAVTTTSCSMTSSSSNNSECVNMMMAMNGASNGDLNINHLSDPRTLCMIIESIYSELSNGGTSSSSSSSSSGTNLLKESDANSTTAVEANRQLTDDSGRGSSASGTVRASASSTDSRLNFILDTVESSSSCDSVDSLNRNKTTDILNELKNCKLMTNNANQKIAIELVECKIKLKQLINEM